MKRKKGPATVMIEVPVEGGERVRFQIPISHYTKLQMIAQARSRTLGREVSFDEIVIEGLMFGAEKMLKDLRDAGKL